MALAEIRINLLNAYIYWSEYWIFFEDFLEGLKVSLQAQIPFPGLAVTRVVLNKEEGGKLLSIQEQIQWRLLNRGKEILNVIPLVELAVVWRKTMEHSVYTIGIAWKIPLNSEHFHGKEKITCFFSMHSFFGAELLDWESWALPLCVQLYFFIIIIVWA